MHAFIPVSEDQGMIDAVNAGALTLEKLEAMTCVCSVGLDMVVWRITKNNKLGTADTVIFFCQFCGLFNDISH